MRVFGPYGVVLYVMETPKPKIKVDFNGRIKRNLQFLNSDKKAGSQFKLNGYYLSDL